MVRVIAHTYHAYHASATPEELCLEAWTVDCGFWLDKKPHRATVAGKLRQALGMRTLERSYPTSTPSPRRRHD